MPKLLLSRTCHPETNKLAAIAKVTHWNVQWLGRRHGPAHLDGDDFALYAETDVALRVARLHDLALIEPTLNIRSTPVLVAEPVEWQVEYRAVVLERRMVAFSPYIRGGWLARDSEGRWPLFTDETNAMRRFCELFLADGKVDLPPAFVLDLGTIAGRGWAVVEMNPVWCSGLLGCELAAVLPALRRACWRRSHLRDDDKRWVFSR